MIKSRDVDCLIVGGGPAGLTAATYLARYRRELLVVDRGDSRASWIPLSHNCPGFPEGISGNDLLKRLREQAGRYGVAVEHGEISGLKKTEDGRFLAHVDSGEVRARKVLLATGIVDREPDIDNIKRVVRDGHVRICPICDGYEAIDKSIAVLGPIATAAKKALFLRTFTSAITVLPLGPDLTLDDDMSGRLDEAGIRVLSSPVADLAVDGEEVAALLENGERCEIEILYPAMGAEVNSGLAASLGAEVNKEGCIVTDAHQQTSLPGLYAAGDVVNELNQLSVAFGHAAVAATHMHNTLREEDADARH
ncbi:thioredoxin reductase (NADPH) [Faunimonas pinastri]|uniref:Thioredoxin reductase n=1 Tax=Faunimonas pinastri TaxID=1855383 RepID=A0A1H9AQ51_9HYPH|nr:NAD(P)/FAD-dependent oxidoreductase [Faunimonas pinastri]SEP78896.1 thioredoxin reductase (NADPH) [Faunimonas pinastri]